jgi:DNA-binding transcriptional LysR family regulator
METRRLDYFVHVVDFGSITKAAAQIGIAQPALSQQIQILEHEFRVKLLHRTATGVSPTQAGSDLYRHARLMLRQLEQARQVLSLGETAPAGLVAVGLPTSTALLMSLPLLEGVRARYPAIHLRITEGLSGYLTELLMNARLDVAVLFQRGNVAGLHIEPLWEEELLFIAPASFKGRRTSIRLEQAAGLPLVMPARGHGARTVLDVALARANLLPTYVAEVDSNATLKSAVRAGLGYSFLPWAAVHEEVANGELVALSVTDAALHRTVSLCTPSAAPASRAMECVQELLRETAYRLVGSKSVRGINAPN